MLRNLIRIESKRILFRKETFWDEIMLWKFNQEKLNRDNENEEQEDDDQNKNHDENKNENDDEDDDEDDDENDDENNENRLHSLIFYNCCSSRNKTFSKVHQIIDSIDIFFSFDQENSCRK